MSPFQSILLFSSIFLDFSTSKSLKRPKRQQDNCKDTVALQDCVVGKNDDDETIHLLRIKSNQIVAHFQTECDFDEIKYHWLLRDEDLKNHVDTETNTNTYILEPFALKSGLYAVQITVKLLRKESKNELHAACLVSIDALDPLPIISGGTERTIEAGHSFIMDASESIDRDVPLRAPPKLSFKWQCQVLIGQEKSFCQKEYHGSTLVVPPSTNQKYLFTLSVKTDSSTWVSTNQTVTILLKASELEIICEKNCPPAAPLTVPQRLTFLRVICRRNCEGVEESAYTWTVDNFDYQNTQFGRNSDKFIVKEDVFKPGQVKIRVDLKSGGTASETLTIQEPIKIESCQAKPTQGVAIETKFKVECKYTGEGYNFEVLTRKNGQVVVLNRNYKLEGLEFVLPVGTNVYVKIIDAEEFSDEFELKVQVNTGDTSDTEITHLTTSTIPNLIKTGDTDLAVQITNALIETLDTKGPSTTTKSTKMALLRNFQNIRIKSQAKARQIAQLVARLVHKSESDPDRGQVA
ncbi:polycystin-1-like, partial [Tribolium madens]|uniref:polycystin-1-like n=1 Tax=Tribolium madens TaxID=41895 RepID=UPI001CF74CA1